MGKPSVPTPPDPTATVAAQSAADKASALQTAELNRINQVTPYGSINYTTSGTFPDGTPKYTQTQTLAPAQQSLLNLANTGELSLANTGVGMLGQVSSQYANPIDYSGVPGIASQVNGGQSIADSIQQAQNAAYGAQTQYLDPRFQQGQAQLDNQLINQGITQGSDAWKTAEQNFGLQKNQAYQSAQDAAVAAGNQQQQALYGEGLSSANLQNNASQQALQQLYAKQNQPLNEFNALASGSQVTQPTFSNFGQVQVPNTNVAGIMNSSYQNQLAAYQAQLQANPWNSILSLGGSLGAALIA